MSTKFALSGLFCVNCVFLHNLCFLDFPVLIDFAIVASMPQNLSYYNTAENFVEKTAVGKHL